MHVPLAKSADVSDDNLKGGKVKDGDGVKGDIKQDQSPLEEGIRSIRYTKLATQLSHCTFCDLPPATRWTLCWMKKYTKGTRVPKKEPAIYLRYLIAVGFSGLNAMQPRVQGKVATR